jgi:hypothetical protein
MPSPGVQRIESRRGGTTLHPATAGLHAPLKEPDLGICFCTSPKRAGLFWLEGLPLSARTNQLSVTATDVAGNSNSTNIAIVQSGMVLTAGDFSSANLKFNHYNHASDW